MNSSKRFIAILSLALLFAAAFSGVARADEWNHATKLTFSGPVEVPGQILPAGTYWFTLYNSNSTRNIVQIWDGDRMHLLNTILAIPHYRLNPKGETIINFEERPSGSPEAIHTWFYPNTRYGLEFVYPKTRATLLAAQNHEPVLSMSDDRVSDAAPQLQQAPVKEVTPSGEEVEVAEVIGTEEVAALPQTGSLLPLYGVLGFLSLAAGFGLRLSTQKSS